MIAEATPTDELVVSPAGEVFDARRQPLRLRRLHRRPASRSPTPRSRSTPRPAPSGKANGPFPARIESLETEPAFDAADHRRRSRLRQGRLRHRHRLRQGGRVATCWRWSARAASYRRPRRRRASRSERRPTIPASASRRPPIHTPTADDVGDVCEIDTRVPHDTMHEVDLADVLGKEPVVLLFATPALCMSRVCGPVVDVAEQVKPELRRRGRLHPHGGLQRQHPNKGSRPQLADVRPADRALAVRDRRRRRGRAGAIEGAFSVAELERRSRPRRRRSAARTYSGASPFIRVMCTPALSSLTAWAAIDAAGSGDVLVMAPMADLHVRLCRARSRLVGWSPIQRSFAVVVIGEQRLEPGVRLHLDRVVAAVHRRRVQVARHVTRADPVLAQQVSPGGRSPGTRPRHRRAGRSRSSRRRSRRPGTRTGPGSPR